MSNTTSTIGTFIQTHGISVILKGVIAVASMVGIKEINQDTALAIASWVAAGVAIIVDVLVRKYQINTALLTPSPTQQAEKKDEVVN